MDVSSIEILDDVSAWISNFNLLASNVASAFETSAVFSGFMQVESNVNISGSLSIASNLSVSGDATLGGIMRLTSQSLTASGSQVSNASVYYCDASAGDVGLTLCAASDLADAISFIRRVDSTGNTMRITVSGGDDLIEGATSLDLGANSALILISDGSSWKSFS